VWQEFDYHIGVCRVTKGAHIEALWWMHIKSGQLSFQLAHDMIVHFNKYEIYTYLKPCHSFRNALIWHFSYNTLLLVSLSLIATLYCMFFLLDTGSSLRVFSAGEYPKLIFKLKNSYNIIPSCSGGFIFGLRVQLYLLYIWRQELMSDRHSWNVKMVYLDWVIVIVVIIIIIIIWKVNDDTV
jgi:hypothetical protein